jgi:hypothetical protein
MTNNVQLFRKFIIPLFLVCSTCFKQYYRSSPGASKLQLQLIILLTFVVNGRCHDLSYISKYRIRLKYLTILQNSCEWNRWRGEFVLERSSSMTQNISVVMESWSVKHRAFAVETYFKNNDSVLTQRIFRRHFNIHRNECP